MPCSKRMANCPVSCLHRAKVQDYVWERQRWEAQREAVARDYGPENRDYARDNPPLSFKDYLKQTKREPEMVDLPYNKQPKLSVEEIAEGKAYIRGLISSDMKSVADRVDQQRSAIREWQADLHPKCSITETRMMTERDLLGTVMKAPSALPALQVLDTDRELLHPLHQNVARAIVDLADQGLPYDAEAVTAELRTRPLSDFERYPEPVTDKPYGPDNPWRPSPAEPPTQLPWHMDPEKIHPSMAPEKIGLAEWEANALPAQVAPEYAMEIRTAYRGDYLAQVCERGAANARGVTEASVSGYPGTDSAGTVLHQLAQELVNVPPELGYDLQPTRPAAEASSIRSVTPPYMALDIPPRPIMTTQMVRKMVQGMPEAG